MDIKDLKPGDVLLFSGEKGSFISEAIMFLTNSRVSHAALVYTDPAKIVEETPPAVQVNLASKRFEGRTIYVNRLTPTPNSLSPVLKAAWRNRCLVLSRRSCPSGLDNSSRQRG